MKTIVQQVKASEKVFTETEEHHYLMRVLPWVECVTENTAYGTTFGKRRN